MGIVPGKCYSCEWMVGGIYKADLKAGLKSPEAGQDEKEPAVFLQWLTRGSWGKARWQKYLPAANARGQRSIGAEVSQTIKVTRKQSTPDMKPEQTGREMTMMKWQGSGCPNSRNQEKEITNSTTFLYKVVMYLSSYEKLTWMALTISFKLRNLQFRKLSRN